MAVAVIIDIPGGNEQMIAKLFPEGKLPDGWQVHIAGPSENGWRVINVVPSQEQFEAFARELVGNGHHVMLIDRDPTKVETTRIPDADWVLADAAELA